MDNSELIKELSETTALAKYNEEQIHILHNDVAEIKKENQAIHDIAASVKLIAQDMSYVKEDVAEVKSSQSQIKSELAEVKNAPAKAKAVFVDNIGKLILTAVVSGLAGFILSQICPAIF